MRTEDHTELIGVGGYAEAGKDTYADLLKELYPEKKYVVIGMSDILRAGISRLDPWIQISDDEFVRFTELLDDLQDAGYSFAEAYTRSKKIPDVREFLQRLGTEVGRNLIHEDVWVDATLRKVNEARMRGMSVILTGIRYKNELNLVHSNGGRSVWIQNDRIRPVNSHTSERSVSPEDFHKIVENNGTVADLRELLRKEKNV